MPSDIFKKIQFFLVGDYKQHSAADLKVMLLSNLQESNNCKSCYFVMKGSWETQNVPLSSFLKFIFQNF